MYTTYNTVAKTKHEKIRREQYLHQCPLQNHTSFSDLHKFAHYCDDLSRLYNTMVVCFHSSLFK